MDLARLELARQPAGPRRRAGGRPRSARHRPALDPLLRRAVSDPRPAARERLDRDRALARLAPRGRHGAERPCFRPRLRGPPAEDLRGELDRRRARAVRARRQRDHAVRARDGRRGSSRASGRARRAAAAARPRCRGRGARAPAPRGGRGRGCAGRRARSRRAPPTSARWLAVVQSLPIRSRLVRSVAVSGRPSCEQRVAGGHEQRRTGRA